MNVKSSSLCLVTLIQLAHADADAPGRKRKAERLQTGRWYEVPLEDAPVLGRRGSPDVHTAAVQGAGIAARELPSVHPAFHPHGYREGGPQDPGARKAEGLVQSLSKDGQARGG